MTDKLPIESDDESDTSIRDDRNPRSGSPPMQSNDESETSSDGQKPRTSPMTENNYESDASSGNNRKPSSTSQTDNNSESETVSNDPRQSSSQTHSNDGSETASASDDRKTACSQSEANEESVKPNGKGSFPKTLMFMIDNETDADSKSIRWLNEGNGFEVLNQNAFEKDVIPKYFKGPCAFSSFVRKLYRWNFRQIDKNTTGYYVFVNENFQRGKQCDAKKMRATAAKKPEADISTDIEENQAQHMTNPIIPTPEQVLAFYANLNSNNDSNFMSGNALVQEAVANFLSLASQHPPQLSSRYPMQHTLQNAPQQASLSGSPALAAGQNTLAGASCNQLNFQNSQVYANANANVYTTQLQQQMALNIIWSQMLPSINVTLLQSQSPFAVNAIVEQVNRYIIQTNLPPQGINHAPAALSFVPQANANMVPSHLPVDPATALRMFQNYSAQTQALPNVQSIHHHFFPRASLATNQPAIQDVTRAQDLNSSPCRGRNSGTDHSSQTNVAAASGSSRDDLKRQTSARKRSRSPSPDNEPNI